MNNNDDLLQNYIESQKRQKEILEETKKRRLKNKNNAEQTEKLRDYQDAIDDCNKALEIDPNNCTPQCLSLMLAVYLKPKVIFLLGYDLNNPIEFTRLKSIIISNPDIRFAYISNPQTKKLDDLDNCFSDTYIKYQEVIDARK